MRHRQPTFFLALLLALHASLALADGLRPIQKDIWASAHFVGTKMGYYHDVASVATFEGKEAYKLTQESAIMDAAGLLTSTTTTYLDADFRPVCEISETCFPGTPARVDRTEARFGASKVECIVNKAGKTEKKTVPIPPGADLTLNYLYSCDLKHPAPGEKLTIVSFDSDELRFKTSTASIGEPTAVEVNGAVHKATPIVDEGESSTSVSYYADGWKLLLQESREGLMVYLPEPREIATVGLSKMPRPTSGKVKANMDILDSVDSPEMLGRLACLELRLTGIAYPKLALTDARQTATYLPNQKAIDYRIATQPFDPAKAVSFPVTAPEFSRQLLATSSIQSGDEQIIRHARKIIGREKNAYKAALKLRKWVHNHVKGREESGTALSASEVLKARKGDCKHYALLLAALARSVGIPTRVVAGLVYTGERQFGFHAWVECYVGEWAPFDAASPFEPVNAMYVKLTENADDSPCLAGLILACQNSRAEVSAVHFSPPNSHLTF